MCVLHLTLGEFELIQPCIDSRPFMPLRLPPRPPTLWVSSYPTLSIDANLYHSQPSSELKRSPGSPESLPFVTPVDRIDAIAPTTIHAPASTQLGTQTTRITPPPVFGEPAAAKPCQSPPQFLSSRY